VKATDFTRDNCKLGHRLITYACLERDYRCNDCGGLITTKWSEEEGWHPACLACGSQDFIHEYEVRRQKWEALEVLEGLPPDLAEALGQRQFKSLSLEEGRALLSPPIIEI